MFSAIAATTTALLVLVGVYDTSAGKPLVLVAKSATGLVGSTPERIRPVRLTPAVSVVIAIVTPKSSSVPGIKFVQFSSCK